MFGAYLYDASGESGQYLFVFSPRGGEVTEHFIMLVFTPYERSHRRTFHRYFPQHLSFIRCNNRIGLGTFQFPDFFFRISILHHRRVFGTLQFILETLLSCAGLVITILTVVHGKFKEFFFIISIFPTVLVHFFPIFIQSIRIVQLRIGIHKFISFWFRQFHNFRSQLARQTSALTENHIPRMIIYHRPALLTFHQLHEVHQCYILHILTERRYQRRIPQLRPYVFHLVEEHHQQVVNAEFRFILPS